MIEQAIRRAQAYYFLSHAFLYPRLSWLDELPEALPVFQELGVPLDPQAFTEYKGLDLEQLQSKYRETFGLTGSQCYETEIGLPHEFRQSQELADIAGFYRAFGFQVGGQQHERPDHLSTELEFMYLLALKEAYAIEYGSPDQAVTCQEAQRHFLRDHLGRWTGLFSLSLQRADSDRQDTPGSPDLYGRLARLAGEFISNELSRLGVQLAQADLPGPRPTPFDPDFSCAGCAAAETVSQPGDFNGPHRS